MDPNNIEEEKANECKTVINTDLSSRNEEASSNPRPPTPINMEPNTDIPGNAYVELEGSHTGTTETDTQEVQPEQKNLETIEVLESPTTHSATITECVKEFVQKANNQPIVTENQQGESIVMGRCATVMPKNNTSTKTPLNLSLEATETVGCLVQTYVGKIAGTEKNRQSSSTTSVHPTTNADKKSEISHCTAVERTKTAIVATTTATAIATTETNMAIDPVSIQARQNNSEGTMTLDTNITEQTKTIAEIAAENKTVTTAEKEPSQKTLELPSSTTEDFLYVIKTTESGEQCSKIASGYTDNINMKKRNSNVKSRHVSADTKQSILPSTKTLLERSKQQGSAHPHRFRSKSASGNDEFKRPNFPLKKGNIDDLPFVDVSNYNSLKPFKSWAGISSTKSPYNFSTPIKKLEKVDAHPSDSCKSSESTTLTDTQRSSDTLSDTKSDDSVITIKSAEETVVLAKKVDHISGKEFLEQTRDRSIPIPSVSCPSEEISTPNIHGSQTSSNINISNTFNSMENYLISATQENITKSLSFTPKHLLEPSEFKIPKRQSKTGTHRPDTYEAPEREFHTIHIETLSSPPSSVIRRPPLYRRLWQIITDFISAIFLCLQVNRDCIFCLGFFVVFVISASFLTAFFYRTLHLSHHQYHREEARVVSDRMFMNVQRNYS